MNPQDTNGPDWFARIAALALFFGLLIVYFYGIVLHAWTLAFWPSMAVSALTATVAAFLGNIVCKGLARNRLLRPDQEPVRGTIAKEHDYIKKAATDLSKVMQRPFEPSDRKTGKKKNRTFVDGIKQNGLRRGVLPTTTKNKRSSNNSPPRTNLSKALLQHSTF